MSYIEFDKEKIVNITYAKNREILRCSRTGSFACSTLLGLNTRKYHGLFIVPQDNIDHERHVLVSSLDATVIIDDMEFPIYIHQYKGGIIEPKGNKFLQKFVADPVPTYFYRVGKFNFKKEILFMRGADRVLLKYSILDDFESATLQLQPLLAFRQIHRLTFMNDAANTGYESVEGGVKYCLYDNYTPVYIQTSAPLYYEHDPVWIKNVEYEEELNRGYEGCEDLLAMGRLNMTVKQKEIYLSVGVEPINPADIEQMYIEESKNRITRNTFFNCLENAADQFIVTRNGKTQIMAGYPWFGRWGRDTFISLQGLTLDRDKPELCKEILDDMLSEMENGLFPNIGEGEQVAYNSVDAPLWFIRALQQYADYTHTEKKIWDEYGTVLKTILSAYKKGSLFNIRMLDNGLIYAGADGVALTWMDAVIDGRPVTPRTGCQVEINGLWYNALRFCIEMAKLAGDESFVDEWKDLAQNFPAVFKETFWSKEIGWLADYVNGDYRNFQVRPNMMLITGLPYVPISEKIRQLILKKTMEELLVTKGIRTLSPNDPEYKGHYGGTQAERDAEYHQGTAWPWLLGPFSDGMLAVYQKSALSLIERLLYNFEGCMRDYGVSTIAEVYDGDPPYRPNGAISQAWSVAALLHMKRLLENAKRK
ncbi:MAG: glycogen debranching enzyme family protein [Bacteroidales bacterium]|nr:glycogen debranching enzyme family protein [Bacteroidales bacterium]